MEAKQIVKLDKNIWYQNGQIRLIRLIGKSELRESLTAMIPENPNQPYDMKEVIQGIVDADSFFDLDSSTFFLLAGGNSK